MRILLVILMLLPLAACSGILPRESSTSRTSWATFDDAQKAYNSIEPGKSTAQNLKSLGFDPTAAANVEILDYVAIINRMSPIFTEENLPTGIRQCLEAKTRCKGYLMTIKHIKRDRTGNVALDLLGFRKETKVTGWQLGTTIILVDDVVVYKSWVGTPEVAETEKKIIPLGPLQNLGDFFIP